MLGGWLALWGTVAVAQAGLMVRSSRTGKLRERDRLLDALPWRGDERVLDVGCGRGLLLVGSARRLTIGRAVGLDLWRRQDQAGNDPAVATDRAAAIGEIVRVLRPGGRVAILDFRGTGRYAAALRAAGLDHVHRSQRRFGMYPPVPMVTATKA